MDKNGFFDKSILFIICVLTGINVNAQEIYTGSVVYDDENYSFDISILYEKKSIKTFPGIHYFWYRNGKLKSTIGGYSGNLLHGTYEKFDMAGNLRSKGDFLFGVKNGKWKYWSENGLVEIEEKWDKGFLVKRVSYEKNIILTEPFKNNLLHGKVVRKNKNEIISTQKYWKGEKIEEENSKLLTWIGKLFKNKSGENESEHHKTSSVED